MHEEVATGTYLEKKDSKDSNCTITADSVLLRSSSYNQTDRLASSESDSVFDMEEADAQHVSARFSSLTFMR